MTVRWRTVTNPERDLWQTVLYQAVVDALHGPTDTPKIHRAREWQAARAFITTPSEDLAMICAMAGVEMEALVERMRAWIIGTLRPEIMAGANRENPAKLPMLEAGLDQLKRHQVSYQSQMPSRKQHS